VKELGKFNMHNAHAVDRKLSKLIHACQHYSLPKLAHTTTTTTTTTAFCINSVHFVLF